MNPLTGTCGENCPDNYYLNEYDPFFDYYASKFLVDHFDTQGIRGFLDYFSWHDYKTWYPEGRPVARTSQVA